MKKNDARAWWESAVFYQIYPRSFFDSNGDGVGDLRGIISKLDYLVELGVDALWISPFFKSPMKDFGYDISDYRGIDPLFGTMEDCMRLIAEAHDRGLRLVFDLVVNHSSIEHPWFREARSSRENPRHDWYLWHNRTGRKPPNNWISLFEQRSAWYPNEATDEWYLATFTRHQPEFNWRNAGLRAAVYAEARFWLDKGVDGFRLDVASAYIKDDQLRNNPFKLNVIPDIFQEHLYDRNRPEVHEIFRELRGLSDEYGDRFLIGETHGRDAALAASCHGRHDDELHEAFNFGFLFQKWSARGFRRSAEGWYALLPENAWPNFTLSNHDQARHYWRYRQGKNTDARARVAAAMLLCLRGTPFLYYGEELGMTCMRIRRKALRDPLGIATWPLSFIGRDPERTPMQWSAEKHAGFSVSHPWLPVNPEYKQKNVETQKADPRSLWHWYAGLIRLRKDYACLRLGSLEFLDSHPDLLVFSREQGNENLLVCLNFSARKACFAFPCGIVLFGTHRCGGMTIPMGTELLNSYEVCILKLL